MCSPFLFLWDVLFKPFSWGALDNCSQPKCVICTRSLFYWGQCDIPFLRCTLPRYKEVCFQSKFWRGDSMIIIHGCTSSLSQLFLFIMPFFFSFYRPCKTIIKSHVKQHAFISPLTCRYPSSVSALEFLHHIQPEVVYGFKC